MRRDDPIVPPTPDEAICPVSYEVAALRLNGGPADRKGFWKAYREELDLNKRTNYRSDRVRICANILVSLKKKPKAPIYFRDGALTDPEFFRPDPFDAVK